MANDFIEPNDAPDAPDNGDSGSSGFVDEAKDKTRSAAQGLGYGALRVGFGTAALAANGARSMGNLAKNLWTRMMGLALSAGTGISAATGGMITARAGAMLAGTGSVLSSVTTIALIVSMIVVPAGRKDGIIELCETPVTTNPFTIDAGDMTENAKLVYGALSYLGMNDQNIAGILGNFETESGIDPTSVEGIFDEPNTIGPRKRAAWDKNFEPQPMGIGLGQWTAGRTQMLLDFAADRNRDWHYIDVQLAFAIGGDNESDRKVFLEMVDNKNASSNSPTAASEYFLREWERPADVAGNAPIRAEQASKWYAQMGGWQKNSTLGESVISMADGAAAKATARDEQDALNDCPEEDRTSGGNTSAAEAMVTISHPYLADSRGNDGTDIYRYIHDEVLTGDPYYASCDRGVATAIRWSGTDDTFPAGPTAAQYEYVVGTGSSRWEEIGNLATMSESDLLPGDVLLGAPNHVAMYVSNEVVVDMLGPGNSEPNAAIGHASLNDRSPALDTLSLDGWGVNFKVFRNTKSETNSVFSGVQIPAGKEIGEMTNPTMTTPSG